MIIGVIGGIGSGKTLTMTRYLYDDFNNGRTIYTNYRLRFGRTNRIIWLDKEFFHNYKSSNFDVQNASVAIDEAHVFVDSRRAMSPRNKIFSQFLTQSRKRSVDLYYTTQDVSIYTFFGSGQVDLRLRKLTDYIVLCSSVAKGKHHYVINEWYDQSCKCIGTKMFFGNLYYDKYDTNEIVDLID